MTKKDISEIFSIWSLNWPASEMLQGGEDLLDARITLYADRLKDVNPWYGRKAAMLSIDTRRFLPSIAEYLEDIEKVKSSTSQTIDFLLSQIVNEVRLAKAEGRQLKSSDILPAGREVIERMGGWKAFAPESKPFFNRAGFEEAYIRLEIDKELALGSGRSLPPKR